MASSAYRSPRSAQDLTRQNVEAIRELDRAAVERGHSADRAAALIANWCGRIQFVWIHVAWFSSWVLWNTLPGLPHFDPYPFTFLVLVVSLEAIFLATFVLMSQNHEMRLTERRNQLALQINLLAEQENTKILQLLTRIAGKLDIDVQDPMIQALEEATRPEQLIEQIERAYRGTKAEDEGRRGPAPP